MGSVTPRDANAEAQRIAAALGEAGAEGQSPLPLVLMQLSRIVRLMGVAWTDAHLNEAVGSFEDDARTVRSDGKERSVGGIFFAICRQHAFPAIATGVLTRRDFCRTFCVRPREAKAPKPPPREGKKARREKTHEWTPRHKQPAVEAEVYVVRRKTV